MTLGKVLTVGMSVDLGGRGGLAPDNTLTLKNQTNTGAVATNVTSQRWPPACRSTSAPANKLTLAGTGNTGSVSNVNTRGTANDTITLGAGGDWFHRSGGRQ